jgi:hypothetical protein
VKRLLALGAATAVLTVTAACGGGDAEPGVSPEPSTSSTADPSPTPSATADTGVRVEVTISEDGVDPRGDRVDVGVGEPVTLVVTSAIADEVHVHSDPEVSIEVQPGETVERTFTIDRPGQVAVESHETGATILQLVVQ